MQLNDNIRLMDRAVSDNVGMDVIIVSTGSQQQEQYWQKRLMSLRGHLIKPSAHVVCIHEDWPGGAGNGLGTLYAYSKAVEKAKDTYGLDIIQAQENGASIAIYHTAGEGSRLFPLTGSENGNKPAVKLPAFLSGSQSRQLLSVLEAVIKQTAIYAPGHKGRVSVFWGDQVFIPSNSCSTTPKHHVEILARFLPFPAKEDWQQRGYEKYGILIPKQNNTGILVEKADYPSIEALADAKTGAKGHGIGLSLGCFSLSMPFLLGLLNIFREELKDKKKKLESDTHFWMPLTLDQDAYIKLMQKKNVPSDISRSHFSRMQAFKDNFCRAHPELELFGGADIGAQSYWWDYGTIALYYQNNMKIVHQNAEGKILRQFYGLVNIQPAQGKVLQADKNSVLVNCEIDSGSITNSILFNVKARHVDVDNSLIIDSELKTLEARQCLLYKVVETESLAMEEGGIRADIHIPALKKHFKMFTNLKRDGKVDWKVRLPQNPLSYEELYRLIQTGVD